MYAFAAAASPSPAWAALSHMHELGLVHRGMFALHMPTPFPLLHAASRNPSPPPPHSFAPDIKPENIFLRKSGGRLFAVIGDFGAAAMATRTVLHFFTV